MIRKKKKGSDSMSYSEKPTISKQIEENNKIIIEITGANEPPKVTIGGQEVAVKGLEYYFETDTDTPGINEDRKSTRLNSSHVAISYAVFCLKKKKKNK